MAVTPNDPGGVALRRAPRTAVVLPLVFALSIVVLDRKNMAIFASFGSFAMLGLADFGGPPWARVAAYLSATAVGCVLIAIATPVSGDPWLGALLMAAVGSVVMFGGVLGGYASAGTGAVTLAFVLAVTIPASPDEIPTRLAGWALGGITLAVAAVVLWPAHETDAIRKQARTTFGGRWPTCSPRASTASVNRPSVMRLHQQADDESLELDRIARNTPTRPSDRLRGSRHWPISSTRRAALARSSASSSTSSSTPTTGCWMPIVTWCTPRSSCSKRWLTTVSPTWLR